MERTFFIALHITCQTEVVRGHDTWQAKDVLLSLPTSFTFKVYIVLTVRVRTYSVT